VYQNATALQLTDLIVLQILILIGGNVISRFGVYRVVMITFIIQVLGSLLLFLMGQFSYWVLVTFMLLDM